MPKVALVLGTRPECNKLAPVYAELRRRAEHFEARLIVTGQHREMLRQMLEVFELVPDHDLEVMVPGQGLGELTARLVDSLTQTLRDERPDCVLVQGDTCTTMAGALAAFYHKVPVGHVEAGLRTGERYSPFPEEMYRRLTGQIADLHLAATRRARHNLQAEGVDPLSIFVTGNTVVDALQAIRARSSSLHGTPWEWVEALEGRLVLATVHRRENWGVPFTRICAALQGLTERFRDVTLLFATHLNPRVKQSAQELLGGVERVVLCDPPDYLHFVRLMERADLIITDSGGIQEEAPTLGVPTLVVRETTERPEGVEVGAVLLVGTETEVILARAAALLDDPAQYAQAAEAPNPYGDGRAASRVVDAVEYRLGLRTERPADFDYLAARAD